MKRTSFVGIAFLLIFLPLSLVLGQSVPQDYLLHLDATLGVATSNSIVSEWIDQSPNKFVLWQSAKDNQPKLMEEQGRRFLRFDGNQYLEAVTSFFPTHHDYTFTAVVRVNEGSAPNNILAGKDHTIWLNGSKYPAVVHDRHFPDQAVSSVAIANGWNVITVRYNEYDNQAKLYVNGEPGDSLFVFSNSDSTVYLGSFDRAYFLKGDIAEIQLFDRELSVTERVALDNATLAKYQIAHAAPSPLPDSTFAHAPAFYQLYPRDEHDSAEVLIDGKLRSRTVTSLRLRITQNGASYMESSILLRDENGSASFRFSPKIAAGLYEYHFQVTGSLSNGQDTLLLDRDSVVCGDVYLISGESNSTFGDWQQTYTNEYARCFGFNLSRNVRDTLWSRSRNELWGTGPSVNTWGLRLQQRLIEEQHMPTCVIAGGVSGTILIHFLRDDKIPENMMTIYGRMLYRLRKAGLDKAAKALFWFHGELDNFDGYYENFKTLVASWKKDYPALKRFYIVQMRPAFCVNLHDENLRDLQRTIEDSLPDFTSVASAAISGQDGCHFTHEGYTDVGDRFYRILAKDFYHSADTVDVESPAITKAFFTNATKKEIALVFRRVEGTLSGTLDTLINGVHQTLKDYFFIGEQDEKVQSIRYEKDTVFLALDHPSTAQYISYLPDRYYRNDTVFYEGPWLVSSKGMGALLFYKYPIGTAESIVVRSQATPSGLRAFPNPFVHSTSIQFDVPNAGIAELAIYDVLGRARYAQSILAKEGRNILELQLPLLQAGAYIVRMTGAGIEKELSLIAR